MQSLEYFSTLQVSLKKVQISGEYGRNLLNDIANITKFEIEERKRSLSRINEDNLGVKFNYSNLSNKLKKIILN